MAFNNRRNTPTEQRAKNNRDFHEQIFKLRMRRLGRAALIFVIAAITVGGIYLSDKNKIYTEYEIKNVYERHVAEKTKTILLNRSILTYSNDGAECCDMKGKAIWNETFEMQSPIVATSGGTVAIGDYNGRHIYVMNTEEVLGMITTNLPIRALCVSEGGIVAAVLDDMEVTWIELFNAAGEELATFKTTMSQSGYPIDVAISPNSILVAVSYLSAQDNAVRSSVAFYNFGEVGQNEVDNYMSGYDYQAVVPYVHFMTSNLAVAVADDRLMFYEGAQKPMSKAEILIENEMLGIYHNEQYVAVVTYDSTGEKKYLISVYDSSGNLKLSKGIDMEFKDILMKDDLLYIFSETDCLIYNTAGVEKYSGTMDENISVLIPGDSIKNLSLVSNRKIQALQLK